MATFKFTETSPFEGIAERKPHHSDFLMKEFASAVEKITSLSGGAPITAAEKDPRTKADPKVVRLALFGLGRAGTIHLGNICGNPRVELVYAVEADKSKWDVVRDQWNLKYTTFLEPTDAEKVFNDPNVDACLIATPTFTHEPFICGSLKGGKAVFSEKPISETSEGAARCYALAAEVGKPLFCAFNRRFDPSFASCQERVRAGELGHVHVIKATSRDSPLPSLAYLKISGGIFHDCAVHDIDLITWMLGEYPEEVSSTSNALIPEIKEIGDFDNVSITMKFPSGTIGLVDLSRFSSYGYDQRIEVFGPKGMIRVENDEPNRAVHTTASGEHKVPMYYSFPSRHYHGYCLELNHFLDVAQGHAESSVDSRMVMAIARIATAAEESARSGMPVKMEWKDEEVPEGYVKVSKK